MNSYEITTQMKTLWQYVHLVLLFYYLSLKHFTNRNFEVLLKSDFRHFCGGEMIKRVCTPESVMYYKNT